MRKFEWAVIGSGIAGTTIAEILTRQGHSVVLIEKNDNLSSETTRDFHEWLHTGKVLYLNTWSRKCIKIYLRSN